MIFEIIRVLLLLQLIKLIPTTINLSNSLESNNFIDDDRFNHKNRQPCHNLPQTCAGSKSVCQVWIRPTDNFLAQPRTSFRINELWSNKNDTPKSTINKRSLERRTWRMFLIKKSNQLKQTILNTQPAPFPWCSTNLQGNQICMSSLYTDHRKFANTPKFKFQYQWMLIRLMQTNRSTINDANKITKTPRKKTWQIINRRNHYDL